MNLSQLRKIIALILFPSAAFAWMGSGGSPDYSRDASNMFICASTGTVGTQAGVSISSPTISLYNPSGSGKNVVVLEVTPVFMASPAAAAAFALAYNLAPSSGTATGVAGGTGVPGNVTSALVGKSTGTLTNASARCVLQGILPATPTLFRYLSGVTGASAIGGLNAADQTQGKIVIPPGGLISLQTTSSVSAQASIVWREEPL